MNKKFLLASVIILALGINAFSNKSKDSIKQNIEKIELKNLSVVDYPSDKGNSIILYFDKDEKQKNFQYEIYLSTDSTNWIKAKQARYDELSASNIELPFWMWNKKRNINALAIDVTKVFSISEDDYFNQNPKGFSVYAKVIAIGDNKKYESQIVKGIAKANWFRVDRLNNLVLVIIISIVFFIIVSHAKKRELFIRKIAGLEAIDEAVGRATEMGKPVVYVPGIGSMSGISTIASIFILGEVGKKIAQYDATLKVPHYDPIVFTVAKETVKQSYMEAERPDSYREDINVYITSDQFAYAAAVDGIITREKPAACFYMGYFMAESLLLAEVGAGVGAIQIAGTDVDSQLPFFFTACDYTLIGEELYAAGAYLSKEPMLVSALKVQDFGKLLFITFAIGFSILLLIFSKIETSYAEKLLDIFRVR
jgi:hypothetical protein